MLFWDIHSDRKHKYKTRSLKVRRHKKTNIRKEAAEKRHVDKWCKASEVDVCCHIHHTATPRQLFKIPCS